MCGEQSVSPCCSPSPRLSSRPDSAGGTFPPRHQVLFASQSVSSSSPSRLNRILSPRRCQKPVVAAKAKIVLNCVGPRGGRADSHRAALHFSCLVGMLRNLNSFSHLLVCRTLISFLFQQKSPPKSSSSPTPRAWYCPVVSEHMATFTCSQPTTSLIISWSWFSRQRRGNGFILHSICSFVAFIHFPPVYALVISAMLRDVRIISVSTA